VLALAAAALLGIAPGVRAEPAATRAEIFDQAMQLYRDCRWAAAFGQFTRLADAGDAESARIALLMLWHGPRLYGSEWSSTPAQG
jgi:hypothetical protein